MANLSLALQGGVALGTEQTFDGQPMQAGTHLRWSFVSAMGFPPGGFQLWRRIDDGDIRVTPPHIAQAPNDPTIGVNVAATGAPPSAAPGWSAPDSTDNGWQSWGSLFTLPVTNAHWPARYYNAPQPTAANVATADVTEAAQRLGSLKLAAGDTPAVQATNLQSLRSQLNGLVNGYPATALGSVPLPAPASGANAPSLKISVMDQLLLLALDPYFARVLGLYFVDTYTAPGVKYDYAIVGYWGNNHAEADIIYPGLASGTQLALGKATWEGLKIVGAGGTSIWRWIKSAGANKQLDPTAPAQSLALVNTALSTLNAASQPAGVMILGSALQKGQTGTAGVSIGISQGTPAVDIQLAGSGTVIAYTQALGQSTVTAMPTVSFNSPEFTTVSIVAPGFYSPIVGITVTGTTPPAPAANFVLVGAVTVYATAPGAIGNLYALLTVPAQITAPPAPGRPVTTFRKRQAVIDTNALKLVPQSLFDVAWPAPTIAASSQTGDPYVDPRALPPPTQPIGFVAKRKDNTAAGPVTAIPGWVASRSVPTPAGSKITTPNLYRLNDSLLPDPASGSSGYSHSVAAFDIFGVLGVASVYSAPVGVEKIAAAPTALRILQFDNSAAGGGAALADGSAWVGGTLNLQVGWDASTFIMYPDIATAEAQLFSIDKTGAQTGSLGAQTFTVPPPTITKLVATVVVTANSDGYSYAVSVTTVPPLPVLVDTDPAAVLMLTAAAPDPTSLRFSVRPVAGASGGVAELTVSSISRLVTSKASFQNQPAYLVSGWSPSSSMLIPVPLSVPVADQTARGQVLVVGSTKTPFDASEQIVDPNGVTPSRPEPQSAPLTFTGAQWMVPAVPQTPLPDVNHIYYDPADATGQAGKDLPFTAPAGSGVLGYVLKRAPIHSLAIADIARRRSSAVGTAFDPNPVSTANGANLAAFIAALPQWLTAFNAINHANATAANVLDTGAGQQSFIEHFYNGLLDEELRTLGDLSGNSTAFARVNPSPIPSSPIHDSVDGTGYGRNLYKLAAVNQAGSQSGDTGSVGPVYTRIVAPPRPPVLYKVQSASAAIVVAWGLDSNPDVAAYLVYRASNPAALADLRYFGQDPSHPAPLNELPSVQDNTQSYPPLTLVQGTGGNIDSRLIGFVPDPRLVARDYTNSVMAEIVLPPGPPPDEVNGVYRQSDYIVMAGATQIGFNYWTPPVSTLPAVVSTPTQTRLTGLRIGLGRGVPVVVVATWSGVKKAIGVVPIRRAGFVDAVSSASTPADPNAIAAAPPPSATAPNFYAVVSVDIFGNRSTPSQIFAGQMFGTP